MNSFQNLLIYFFGVLFLFLQCQDKNNDILPEKKFIEIYAQIYIINEMNIDKRSKAILINDLLDRYNKDLDHIRYTLDYYNEKPGKWLTIVDKIKNKIIEYNRRKGKKY